MDFTIVDSRYSRTGGGGDYYIIHSENTFDNTCRSINMLKHKRLEGQETRCNVVTLYKFLLAGLDRAAKLYFLRVLPKPHSDLRL